MDSYVPESSENKKSSAAGYFWVIVFVIGIVWFINHKPNDYKNGETDPFWEGTERIHVCKVPYYSSQECYTLKVTLIDKKTAQIYFPNSGYKITYRVTCYFSTIYKGPRIVFCRSWDNDGQQWDFEPAWVND